MNDNATSEQATGVEDVSGQAQTAAPDRPVAIVCNPFYAVGSVGMMVGILLCLGNLSGLVPTFRGAGLAVIVLAAVFWHLGIWLPRRREF